MHHFEHNLKFLISSSAAIASLIHIILGVAEIFFWKEPIIHQRLGFTLEEALKVAPIVANAGLYNGFIAAGLIWGLVSGKTGNAIKVFFLSCVIIGSPAQTFYKMAIT